MGGLSGRSISDVVIMIAFVVPEILIDDCHYPKVISSFPPN